MTSLMVVPEDGASARTAMAIPEDKLHCGVLRNGGAKWARQNNCTTLHTNHLAHTTWKGEKKIIAFGIRYPNVTKLFRMSAYDLRAM